MAEEDEDQTMELTIEALTGTVYDLCVSPYETILGIKMKIQRLEGIIKDESQCVYLSVCIIILLLGMRVCVCVQV